MSHTNYQISLVDFSRLEMSGVCEVSSFDEKQIELSLGDSLCFVGGSNLKIESFSRESKTVTITGNIDAFARESAPQEKTRSFFARLFS